MTIAKNIERDLEFRTLLADYDDKVAISGLSEHDGVSSLPVRLALQRLVDKKLLIKAENGRISVAEIDRHNHPRVAPPEPKDHDLLMTKEVLGASLTGIKSYLREEAISERLGIGRTLVKTLLSRAARRALSLHYRSQYLLSMQLVGRLAEQVKANDTSASACR